MNNVLHLPNKLRKKYIEFSFKYVLLSNCWGVSMKTDGSLTKTYKNLNLMHEIAKFVLMHLKNN